MDRAYWLLQDAISQRGSAVAKQPKKESAQEAQTTSLSNRFTQRLIEEQDVRDYTDAGLAHRASQFHPVAANTIWQIRKRGRRVDIDEADAIARAFGFTSVKEFIAIPDEFVKLQIIALETTVAVNGATKWLEQYRRAYAQLEQFADIKRLAALVASPGSYDIPQGVHESPLGLLSDVRESIAEIRTLILGELETSDLLFRSLEEAIDLATKAAEQS